MDTELVKMILAALGPSSAVVIVVLLFLRFLGNHMGANTEAMTRVCSILSALEAKVDECPRRREGA